MSEAVHYDRRRWTREELVVACWLYHQLTFGQLDKHNRKVIELAGLLRRSPSSVAMKLANLASLDKAVTETGRSGLSGASDLDREVWAWFRSNWATGVAEAAEVMDELGRRRAQDCRETQATFPDRATAYRAAGQLTETTATATRRVGQSFFRNAVLANFNGCCAVTGMNMRRMLCASHIVPWAEEPALRLDPGNGLCLNPLLDRAFDRHLIAFDDDGALIVSARIKRLGNGQTIAAFAALEGARLAAPSRIAISSQALQHHRNRLDKE